MKALVYCALMLGALSNSLYGQVQTADTVKDPISGQTFPQQITFDKDGKQYTLEATGATTRKKLVFNVYSIASYVQKGTPLSGNKAQAVVNADVAKQFTMKWLRDIEGEKIRQAYLEGYEKNLSPEQLTKMKGNIDKFIGFFSQDVKKGEEAVIRAFPGGTIEVLLNGKSAGTTADPAFAKATWNIWLGPNSIVDTAQLAR